MRGKKFSIGLRAVLATLIVTLLATSTWAATNWNEKVLHSFNFGDGNQPWAGLIFDAAGNLYGTTAGGGTYRGGTVFELTPTAGGGWTETVLHSFNCCNGTDGFWPFGGLIFDAVGNLYGTTSVGGIYNYGTVFELTPQADGGWTETVLYSFNDNGTDGYSPQAGLILDAAGNLYGTTGDGGTYGGGTVFELTPTAGGGWTEQVLYSFCRQTDCTDGVTPNGGLIFDAAGNLYGTTYLGGTYNYGTVFELTPQAGGDWAEQVLYSFNENGTDGYQPVAGLILDAAGNLYGTTFQGGTYYDGTAFELTPQAGGGWTEQVLHNFGNGGEGWWPVASLIFDATGNLYGTTLYGGTHGEGTVFELTPNGSGGWTETVLYNLGSYGWDAANPHAGLILDAAGNLYGTTLYGGAYDDGAVFELTPIYPCAHCSHSADREVHVFPVERRDALELRKPIE